MKMQHPLNQIPSVSFEGQTYDADENGILDLPDEAAASMAAFGLVEVVADEAPGTDPKPKRRKAEA